MESPVHFASKHRPTYVPAKEREPSIKPASQEEIPYLPAIEHAADAPFRAIGMAAVADMPLPSLEHYAAAQARHHLWVARHPRSPSPSSIVGFYQIKALQHTPDFRAALLTQISILPGYSGRGLGTLMLRYLIDYASVLGYQSVDLTTFDEVPWNRAFYEKVGFKVLTEEELAKDDARVLRELREKEDADETLRQWKRVAMRRVITR